MFRKSFGFLRKIVNPLRNPGNTGEDCRNKRFGEGGWL